MSPAPFSCSDCLGKAGKVWEKEEIKQGNKEETGKSPARREYSVPGPDEEHRGSVRSDRPAPGGGIAKC